MSLSKFMLASFVLNNVLNKYNLYINLYHFHNIYHYFSSLTKFLYLFLGFSVLIPKLLFLTPRHLLLLLCYSILWCSSFFFLLFLLPFFLFFLSNNPSLWFSFTIHNNHMQSWAIDLMVTGCYLHVGIQGDYCSPF